MRRRQQDLFSRERPDPIEYLGRLVVGTNWREPWRGGGGSAGLQQSDIAAALAMVRDPPSREIALAVVTRANEPEIQRVATMVVPRVQQQIEIIGLDHGLQFDRDEDRHRARLVTQDALREIVWPEHRKPYRVLAVAAKMRARAYTEAHKIATSVINESLDEAARTFKRKLR
jgi:hypothetical protein